MNKVFVLAPSEDWIIDRLVHEWNEDNADISASEPRKADVIWLLADFAWHRLAHAGLLRDKKVMTTIHHIVPDKFGPAERMEFQLRDDVTTAYHVPNEHTRAFIEPLTQKPIHVIGYWANQRIWRPTGTREGLRKKHGLPTDVYLIGSFQRDTEGSSIPSGAFVPKLEKGPDLLADAIITMRDRSVRYFQVEVVLAGWRRQYVMKRLTAAGIKYHYFQLPSQDTINELYQAIDLYPVTARYEGGPQALIEAGLLNVPVVSRDVGMARQLLPASAICEDVMTATPTAPSVGDLLLPGGYEPFRKLIGSL